MTAKELAKLLKVNPRTINQYAHLWGGIKVTPTHYRFFEKKVVEVIKNADHHHQEGQAPGSGQSHGAKKALLQALSRRGAPVQKRRRPVGNRHPKMAGTGVDGHGLFVDRGMDELVSG